MPSLTPPPIYLRIPSSVPSSETATHHKATAPTSSPLSASQPADLPSSHPIEEVVRRPAGAKAAAGCSHCATTESPLWRRGELGEVLCNACGLYWKHHSVYRPLLNPVLTANLATSIAAKKPTKRSSKLKRQRSDWSLGRSKQTPHRTATMPTDNFENDYLALRKYTDLPKLARLRPALAPKPLNTNGSANNNSNSSSDRSSSDTIRYIMNGPFLLFPGDHVVVRGQDGHAYFAILTDFSLDPGTRQKRCKLRWLIPKPQFAAELCLEGSDKIGPTMFAVDEAESEWEPLDCVVDVFYSPYACGAGGEKTTGKLELLEDVQAAHLLCSFQ